MNRWWEWFARGPEREKHGFDAMVGGRVCFPWKERYVTGRQTALLVMASSGFKAGECRSPGGVQDLGPPPRATHTHSLKLTNNITCG